MKVMMFRLFTTRDEWFCWHKC